MKRRNAGFTLIELMIAMAIVMVVLYAAINFFIVSVRQYKVQTKITETNVEGILGLELLRQDLESLGLGLPWNLDNAVSYTERTSGSADLLALNDAAPNAPRAVLSINNGTFNNSDYLVIKSARVGMSDAAGKWTTLTQANNKRTWIPATENLGNNDYVIVLALGSTDANRRSLVTSGTDYSTLFSSTANYVPVEPYSANIVYGIDNVQPVRPFNRADYYIDNTSGTVPQRCAPNTGVLVKAVVAHNASGTTPTLLPLLDCVADMQVEYGLDTNADGVVDNTYSDDISSGMTAAVIRGQLMEVRVAILAQEGQRDDSYEYPYNSVSVGSAGAGSTFNFTAFGFTSSGNVINNFKHYRWKVYNIVVKPKNLAQ